MRIRQLFLDARGCTGPLNDADALLAAMRAAAERVGASALSEARAQYVPHGVTAVLFLAESHILVSTWPEHRLALCDILLCNDAMDPQEVAAELVALLHPSQVEPSQVVRHVGP